MVMCTQLSTSRQRGEAFLEEYVRYFKIHLDELLAANKHLKELQMSLVGKGGKGRGGSHNISETRRRFPRAYEKWSTEEDRRLQDEFGRGRSVTELAEVFGRKPGAIRSRLVKNGLITGMTTQGA